MCYMAQQFISNSTVTYDVGIDGVTTVTHDINLENTTSGFYASSFTLSLTGIAPINPQAYEGLQNLPVDVTKDNGSTTLNVKFPDAVVGQGSKREFFLTFQDKTLVAKTGEIWEITTPKLADPNSFDFYSTILKVPNSFGQLAYISPNPTFRGQEKGKMVFSFDKDATVRSTVTAAFGQFQVFSFNLTYHIENPLSDAASIDIAIPPDTDYQKLNYSQITPTPQRVSIDKDGNWLATFILKPKERVDVKVKGSVQLFADSTKILKTNAKAINDDLHLLLLH